MALYNLRYQLKDEQQRPIPSIRISPSGKYFALAVGKTIKVYDLHTKTLLTQLNGHTKGINDIQFSPIDDNILASCSDDCVIYLWSLRSNKYIRCLKKHTYHISSILFSKRGNLLISASADENIIIWDVTKGSIITTLAAHSDPVSSITSTYDDTLIISGAYDGLMRVFDLETNQCLKTLTTGTSHGTATASTTEVINYPISNVEVSPNGKYILSSSLDGMIRLWKYLDNKVIKTYIGVNGDYVCKKYNCETRFLTKMDPPLICSGSDKDGLIVWDIQSKKIVYNYNEVDNEDNAVLSLDSYNEGEILITSSRNGIVNLFDLNENRME